jgi:hypothetical protein
MVRVFSPLLVFFPLCCVDPRAPRTPSFYLTSSADHARSMRPNSSEVGAGLHSFLIEVTKRPGGTLPSLSTTHPGVEIILLWPRC